MTKGHRLLLQDVKCIRMCVKDGGGKYKIDWEEKNHLSKYGNRYCAFRDVDGATDCIFNAVETNDGCQVSVYSDSPKGQAIASSIHLEDFPSLKKVNVMIRLQASGGLLEKQFLAPLALCINKKNTFCNFFAAGAENFRRLTV